MLLLFSRKVQIGALKIMGDTFWLILDPLPLPCDMTFFILQKTLVFCDEITFKNVTWHFGWPPQASFGETVATPLGCYVLFEWPKSKMLPFLSIEIRVNKKWRERVALPTSRFESHWRSLPFDMIITQIWIKSRKKYL